MSKRFNHIDDTIINLLSQWEESKHSLNALLEDEQLKLKTSSALPSPPASPRDFRQQLQYGEDPDNINDSSSLMTNLSRSRSYSGGTRTSSFTKNRLHRIQSLKINRNNHRRSYTGTTTLNESDLTLSPINTTL
jgi:hypothetical protein